MFLRFFLFFLFILFAFPLLAQRPPTAPKGYDQGPWITENLLVAKKGQFVIRLTDRAKKRATRKFKKKRGRLPSERQLQKVIAREFGLRIAKPITSDNIVYARGVRKNTAKIERALRKGLAQHVEENYKVYRFGFEDLASDFICLFTLCWGLDNAGDGLLGTGGVSDIDVDAPEAWSKSQGEGVVVGVIDTGVYYTHPDLAENIWENPREIAGNGIDDDKNGFVDDVRGWDFFNDDNDPNDDNLHGTHVAGIVAAVKGNLHGLVGVAPKAKILPLKMLGADGSGDTSGLLAAIDYAITLKKSGVPLKVLNASLGGGAETQLIKESLRRANAEGILFVAAAGNDGNSNDETPIYPASYGTDLQNVLSVASIENNGALSGFSNYGRESVHLAAPGGNVWSTIFFDLYLPASGTSMAAPYAAGVAALVASRFPNLKPSGIRDRLLNSVKPLDELRGKMKAPGIISAELALQR